MITRHTVAEKLFAHLNHHISLAELVDWAEQVMMDGEVSPRDADVVNEAVARIGVADVQQFGLLWEECEDILHRLGYGLDLRLKKVA
jgi:hypothetical protein